MTKARDTANIVGGGFSGTIAGATMEPTGDTAAGDNAAMGFTAAEGLILTGQGSTNDVTIKNDADADVIEIPTGTVNVTMAGTLGVTGVITGGGLVVPDGSINLADLDIDGGTDIGAALVDADLMVVDDGAGGTNRKATMTRLSTYIATKITGGSLVFIASTGTLSNVASAEFREQDGHFDATKFDSYEFKFLAVKPATDNVALEIQTSTNDGSAYASTNGNYIQVGTDTTGLRVNSYATAGNDTNEFGVSGTTSLLCPHVSSVYTSAVSNTTVFTTNGHVYGMAGASNCTARLAAENTNAVKIIFTSGNITSGEIVMYGVANGS